MLCTRSSLPLLLTLAALSSLGVSGRSWAPPLHPLTCTGCMRTRSVKVKRIRSKDGKARRRHKRMAVYTKPQLEALWAAANPGNGDPHLMAAIALAESAGKTNAGNYCCHGLWQVNTLVHPYTIAQMENPIENAKVAGAILKSQGLGAWESYTNGSYKKYYTGAVTPVSGTTNVSFLGGVDPSELFTNPGGSLGKILGESTGGNPLSLIGKFEQLFSGEFWIKVGKILLGIFLLMAGVLGMG